jgi:hypothetical protein
VPTDVSTRDTLAATDVAEPTRFGTSKTSMPPFVPIRPKIFLLWLSFFHATSCSIQSGSHEQANVKAYLREHLVYWQEVFDEVKRSYPLYQGYPVEQARRARSYPSLKDMLLINFLSRVTGWCFIHTDDYVEACEATERFLNWLDGEEYDVENLAELTKLVELRCGLSGGGSILKYNAVRLTRYLELIDYTEHYQCTKWRRPHLLKDTLQTLSELEH